MKRGFYYLLTASLALLAFSIYLNWTYNVELERRIKHDDSVSKRVVKPEMAKSHTYPQDTLTSVTITQCKYGVIDTSVIDSGYNWVGGEDHRCKCLTTEDAIYCPILYP